MLLPETFTFTQQKLQDYVDCPYRFYLREILKLEWPAVESEPILEQEELMLLGTRFHLLCQQFFSGIPAETISSQINQPMLVEWWRNFLALNLNPKPDSFFVEKLISIPFNNFRLAAKYDLLIMEPDGKKIIYDWKTSQHQPKRQTLLNRMQSKVYPLVASKFMLSKSTSAELIKMIYWYPSFPDSPIQFTYSQSQRDADQHSLEQLIMEIIAKDETGFSKTSQEKTCRFCRFRSLCERGTVIGTKDQQDEPFDVDEIFDLDFDSV